MAYTWIEGKGFPPKKVSVRRKGCLIFRFLRKLTESSTFPRLSQLFYFKQQSIFFMEDQFIEVT